MKFFLRFIGSMANVVFKYAVIFFFIYPAAVFLGFILKILCRRGLVKVLNEDRIPHFKEKVIFVYNHPSMLDPLIVVGLLLNGFLFNPLKYGPLVVSDRKNIYDSWLFFLFRPFIIPVDRGGNSDKSLLKIKRALDKGRRIIIAPEGGRTYAGKEHLYSKKGKRIRVLKEGIGLLVAKTGASVLPIFIDGSDKVLPNYHGRLFHFGFRFHKITIKVGNLVSFEKRELEKDNNKAEITKIVANCLLQLADE